MSHLNSNGLRLNCLDSDGMDFDFGVPLEEDVERSPSPCEEIDAINTETFGEDISGAEFDDLEAYSKQTADLKLDDDYEISGWDNEPSCSLSAPDPSQLPDPTFESVSYLDSSAQYSHPGYGTSDGTVDSLFANNVKTGDSLVWGSSDLSSVITKSAMEFINRRGGLDGVSHMNFRNDSKMYESEVSPFASREEKLKLAEIPKNALTVEELERQQLEEAKNKRLPGVPQGAITLEDLEKDILNPPASVKEEPLSLEVNSPPEIMPPPLTTNFHLSPQSPCIFPVRHLMMNPFTFNLYRARMAGHMVDVTNNFPFLSPQMRAAFLDSVARNASNVGTYRFPILPLSGVSLPPYPSMVQTSRLRMNNMHPSVPLVPSFHNQNQNYPINKNNVFRDSHKKAGLPSSKTISDFAFDPYAGFMSKKEREWLIKIQILQCQGTGNPFEDDFYYTAWRERKLSFQKSVSNRSLEMHECDAYATVSNASHYVPPTFVGSLGKPSLSTVNNPRQLIDLRCDGYEEDDRTSVKVSSQKRFRALLMLIENIAAYVLACEDCKRQLNSTILSDETRVQLNEELKKRIESLSSCLCSDRLSKIISLNKGRCMLVRTFSLLDNVQRLSLFRNFVSKSLPSTVKVVSEEELLLSLLPTLVSYLMHCTTEDLIVIFQSFVFDDVTSQTSSFSNKFLSQLILTILFCLSRKHVELNTSCAPSTLYSYLCGRACPLQMSNDWRSTAIKASTIDEADFVSFRRWLRSQFQRYPGSLGSLLMCVV